MKNKIKKWTAMLVTLVTLLAVMPGQMLVSYAASGKITFSDPSVTVGNQVSVTMKIAASDGASLGASDVRLQYDSSALEFISGTSANGGAGSVRVVGAMEAQNQTTFSFTLKFKALKAGTTSITVTSQEVYDADSQMMTVEHVGSSAVKVNAPETYSKEASLADLTISPGELTPAFSADVTEYTATVGADVEKITVSAPAKDSKASVSVSGNEGLQMGENTVTCKVKAEDGTTTKTYTIVVNKTEEAAAAPEETKETVGEISTEQNSVHNVQSGDWQVADTFDEGLLPEGFTVTEVMYGDRAVQGAVDEKGNILLYMTNTSGAGDFFLYDTQNGILVPYIVVSMAEKSILVLSPEELPEDMVLPEGFADCTIDIGTHTVNGWIWNDKNAGTPEYCVFYGQNEAGERNLYRYDQKEMTVQRYFQDPAAEDTKAKYMEVSNNYNSLLKDYELRGWIIVGLFGFCILLLIILIVLLLTRKPRAHAEKQQMEDFVPTERRTAKRNSRYAEPEELEEEEIEFIEPEMDAENRRAVEQRYGLERPMPTNETPVAPARQTPVDPVPAMPARQVPLGDTQVLPVRQAPMNETPVAPTRQMPVMETPPMKTPSTAEADDDFEFIDLDL